MNETYVRNSIIAGVKKLVAEGLVARTWGNISARLDNEYFIITPSGLSYEQMTADDLVKVRIDDCTYEGEMKPSSEKGIHADAYALRPEINFVIHTHQLYASAVSAAGKDIEIAPCAEYGLPGTAKLRENVKKCYTMKNADNGQYKAFLMERHGAVLLGTDSEDAFNEAQKLEDFCKDLFDKKVVADAGRTADATGKTDGKPASIKNEKPYLDDYAQLVPRGNGKIPKEDEEAVRMVTAKNAAAAAYARAAGPMSPFDALLQRFVYKKKYSKLKNK